MSINDDLRSELLGAVRIRSRLGQIPHSDPWQAARGWTARDEAKALVFTASATDAQFRRMLERVRMIERD